MIISKITWTSSFILVLISEKLKLSGSILLSKFQNWEYLSSKSFLILFCSSSGMLFMLVIKSFLISSLDSTYCFPWSSIAFICFLPWFSIVFACFSKAFPVEKHLNLACSITPLWSDGNISSSVRYSYLSFLPDDNAHIFAASLLISYCSFSSLILPSIVMISFHIFFKRYFLKGERLLDARVASITKKQNGFAVHIESQYLIND